MKKLTNENFDEAIKAGNALVIFHRDGCSNCKTVVPIVEKFKKDGVTVFDIDSDKAQEITLRYAPNDRWQLPLVAYFENGELVSKKTGMMNANDVLTLTKTLQNISDIELQEAQIDMDIQKAGLKKELFNIDVTLMKIHTEMERRMNPQAIATPAQPVAPTDDAKKKEDECVAECQTKCKPTDEDCKAGCYQYCKHVMVEITPADKERIAKEAREKEKNAESFGVDPSLETQCDGCQ